MRTITLKGLKVEASNGLNYLAGSSNTYFMREFIRTTLQGEWCRASRSWRVNPELVALHCGAAAAKKSGADLYLACMWQASQEGERVDWAGVHEALVY